MARRVLVVLSSLLVSAVVLTGCASAPVQNDPLIRLGDQGMAGESGKDAIASDAPWEPVEYSYVAGAGLALAGEPGHIYRLSPKGDPMKVAADVAKVFGVQGQVERIEEAQTVPVPMPAVDGSTASSEAEMSVEPFVYYQVGSKDWTGPAIQLYWSNTGSWYYNNPDAYPQPEPQVGCEAPDIVGDPQQGTVDGTSEPSAGCVYEPVMPKGLPSVDVARAQAVKIFSATGLAVSPSDVRVQADEWGVFASAAYKVDGQPVGIEWSVSWGDGGLISSAGGHALAVEDMGAFDSLSDRDAVKRVGDWRWYGGAASSWYPDMFGSRVPMDDSTVSSGDLPAQDGSAVGPGMQGEPGAPLSPKKVAVVLEKSARALLTVMDQNGGTWLVPGYVFFDSNGGIYPVMSVVPGVIELPEPAEMLR